MKCKKKIGLTIICMMAVTFMASQNMNVKAATLKLNKSKAKITVGDTLKLKVKGAKGKVLWSTNNKKVASVSKKGVVKGKRTGKATITAKITGKNLKCKVTVKKATQKEEIISVEQITLSNSTLDIYTGIPVTLTATVSPDNATNQTIEWTSSNTAVATVQNGIVTGISEGNAIITATADGITSTCELNVKKSGLDKLKEYILLHGRINPYGNRFVSSNQFLDYIEPGTEDLIIYDSEKNCFEFLTSYKLDGLEEKTTMIVYYDRTDAPVRSKVKAPGIKIDASCNLDKTSYSSDTDVIFSNDSGKFNSYETMIANDSLKSGFSGYWATMLYYIGIGFSDLGFSNYK